MTFLHWPVKMWATAAQARGKEYGVSSGLAFTRKPWTARYHCSSDRLAHQRQDRELLGTQIGRSKKKQALFCATCWEVFSVSLCSETHSLFLDTKSPCVLCWSLRCKIKAVCTWACMHTGWAVETGLPDTRTPTYYLLTCFLKEFRVTIFESPLS